VLISFSGGVDSSLLLAAARRVLGTGVKAALCVGPFTPPWEAAAARELAGELGVELKEMDAAELDDAAVAANPPQRCYLCKRRRLTLLIHLAQELGMDCVAEGSQADDAHEDRPGAQAVAELGVKSPLAAAGLSKAQVRALASALGLASAGAPSSACLATRVPMGVAITQTALNRVAAAEIALRSLMPGAQLRVRDHHPLARVELEPGMIARAAAQPMRAEIIRALGQAGYSVCCLDLAGYGTG